MKWIWKEFFEIKAQKTFLWGWELSPSGGDEGRLIAFEWIIKGNGGQTAFMGVNFKLLISLTFYALLAALHLAIILFSNSVSGSLSFSYIWTFIWPFYKSRLHLTITWSEFCVKHFGWNTGCKYFCLFPSGMATDAYVELVIGFMLDVAATLPILLGLEQP